MKKTLKTPGPNMDEHPAVVVTTSTGKAAINFNDITLHSAFGLPVTGVKFLFHLVEIFPKFTKTTSTLR